MALLTTQLITRTTPLLDIDSLAQAAAGGGDSITNDGTVWLYANNQSGSPITITAVFGPGGIVDGIAAPNRTFVVAAGKRAMIGPYPQAAYNNSQGQTAFTYSASASLTVAAFKLGV